MANLHFRYLLQKERRLLLEIVRAILSKSRESKTYVFFICHWNI